MKKILTILLILAVFLVPAFAFAQDGVSLQDTYISSDDLLSQLIENYAELMETREEDIQRYMDMRLNSRGGSFHFARSQATREKNIKQVDYNIENAFDSIKARELQLVINFRNSIANLYSKGISSLDAATAANEAKIEYESFKKSNQAGFISDNALLMHQYSAMQSENTALSLIRSYESALRAFNYKLSNPLDYEDYDFDFSEEIIEINELGFYINHALGNAPSLKIARQDLEKLYIDRKYFDRFSFSGGVSYENDVFRDLGINIRLAELNLEKTEKSIVENITLQYNSLVIERERLDLAELNIEIKKNEYEINESLYYRGYIDKDELSESKELLYAAEEDYIHSVFRYNTMVKSFELICAYYPEESDGQ